MNNLLKSTLTAIVVSAAIAGPAAAATAGDLSKSVRSVIGGDSAIQVHERNGVVTVTGSFGDAGDQAAAINVLKRNKDVTEVINLAFD